MREKEVVLSTEEFNALSVKSIKTLRNAMKSKAVGSSFRFQDEGSWFLCDLQLDQNPPFQVFKIKIRDQPGTDEIAAMPALCPRCVTLLEERDKLLAEVQKLRGRPS